MYGSAIFAIVVSSACMMVARITQTVIAARWAARSGAIMTYSGRERTVRSGLGAGRAGARYRHRPRRSFRRATAAALVARVEANAHRDALHDLHPVAARVLRRQQRE